MCECCYEIPVHMGNLCSPGYKFCTSGMKLLNFFLDLNLVVVYTIVMFSQSVVERLYTFQLIPSYIHGAHNT
jgi:hypothetical protein